MYLGIESSCDESAIAVFDPASGRLEEWLHTQVQLHGKYGGVVPDLASREHMGNFPVLLETLLSESPDLKEGVQQIAVTRGPGLAGCLAIGIAMAKSLSVAWKCPLVGVNHLRAHAFSPFISIYQNDPQGFLGRLKQFLPHVGLLVSGGNTLLFELNADLDIQVLAETVDDAAGEALDKGAKLLGLPYPGGPQIETIAAKGGDPLKYPFPVGRPDKDLTRFSFSGLKTSLRYFLENFDRNQLESALPDICASYENAVVQQLVIRTRKLIQGSDIPFQSLGLSGGVANNQRLRTAFTELGQRLGIDSLFALPQHTGDNASMIVFAAYFDSLLPDKRGIRLDLEPSLRLEM